MLALIEAAIPQGIRLRTEAIALRLRLGAWVRKRSLPDVLRALSKHDRAADPVPLPLVEEAIGASEAIVARLRVLPDTCLYQSLARYAVLRRAGHPARFVMGIKPPADGEITGHAWVELDNSPAFEEIEPDLIVTFSYPEGRVSP
ncbi:MAG: lasso peptide biosynthesis B2 protein [Anaeromyxobacteraceae bacterium]